MPLDYHLEGERLIIESKGQRPWTAWSGSKEPEIIKLPGQEPFTLEDYPKQPGETHDDLVRAIFDLGTFSLDHNWIEAPYVLDANGNKVFDLGDKKDLKLFRKMIQELRAGNNIEIIEP